MISHPTLTNNGSEYIHWKYKKKVAEIEEKFMLQNNLWESFIVRQTIPNSRFFSSLLLTSSIHRYVAWLNRRNFLKWHDTCFVWKPCLPSQNSVCLFPSKKLINYSFIPLFVCLLVLFNYLQQNSLLRERRQWWWREEEWNENEFCFCLWCMW